MKGGNRGRKEQAGRVKEMKGEEVRGRWREMEVGGRKGVGGGGS